MGDQNHDGKSTSDATDEFSHIRVHPCVGRYEIQTTSAAHNLCGMFALCISTCCQLEFGMQLWEFDTFHNSREMREFNERNGDSNVDNFYDEQLAKVLRLWSRYYHNLDIQLGVILEGAEVAYIIGEDKLLAVSSVADMENEQKLTTVWIHNDNAMHLFGAGMNHYSGIRLLGPTEEPNDGSKEAAMTEEGGDTETEDDADMGQRTKEENSAEDSSGDESSTEKESDTESGNESQTGH